jgi:3-phenylpropionate/trans-cinnamate dioxygenase ferredoxin reductase subunit
VGGAIAELHRERGVELVLGEGVQAFEGAGRLERVVTSAGRVLECDFAVVGLGIEPAVELAEGTAVDVDNGIVVDEYCRASVQGIYAAGDVANHFHPLFGRRIRVEHWLNAIDHGAAAARSMLGKGQPYAEVPWFWSDQYDANLQYAGHHTGWDELVVRGSLAERKFAAFYVTGGVVEAVVALDRGREVQRAKRLIASRAPVDTIKLADPEVDLRTLVPAS